ncbi:MAG TPA: hypothetical protein VIT65_16900 [Microlunatus sp.]
MSVPHAGVMSRALAITAAAVLFLSLPACTGDEGKGSGADSTTVGSSGSGIAETSEVPIASSESAPRFLPALGWETSQTAILATAANVPLGPDVLEGNFPAYDTIQQLEVGDVLMQAMFIAPRDSWGDEVFPPRSLPLSLDDAHRHINFEGQPGHIDADRLAATVKGWAVDVLVFYGGGDPTSVPAVRAQPSAETRAAAQEQLARLLVPAR